MRFFLPLMPCSLVPLAKPSLVQFPDVSGDSLPHRLEHHKGFIGQRCFEGVQVSGSSGRRAQQPAERMRAKLRAELRTATEDDPWTCAVTEDLENICAHSYGTATIVFPFFCFWTCVCNKLWDSLAKACARILQSVSKESQARMETKKKRANCLLFAPRVWKYVFEDTYLIWDWIFYP